MPTIDIDFFWHVARSYELAGGKKRVIRQIGAPTDRNEPLRRDGALYLRFAELDGSAEQCLAFARAWGFLETLPGDRAEEEIEVWQHNIALVRALRESLAGAPLSPSLAVRTRITSVDVMLSEASGRRGLIMQPRRLIDAMILQAAQAAASGADILACQQCGQWFEVGAEGKRSIAKFCSDRCRNRFNYERRIQP